MISVIIVNYHSACQTEEAVKSVLQDKAETEIIIVDNSCTESEREVIDKMRAAHGFSLILNNENVGFARACNQAFSRSKGNYIFLLNPDAFVIAPCLSILRDFLESMRTAGSASPQVYWDDEMRYMFPCYPFSSPFQDFCVRLSSLSQAFRTRYSRAIRRRNFDLWRSATPVRVDNLHGGAVMVKRAAVEQSGGLFDEGFFLFYEDTDLFFRMRKKGYSLYVVPEAKAVHHYSHNRKKLEIMSRTAQLYYEKHFSRSLLLRLTSLMPAGSLEGAYHDYGLWKTPPSLPVPAELKGAYLFEWSPHPLFIPSIGYFGRGAECVLSRQVWDSLDADRYYVRFTSPVRNPAQCATGYWKKEV
ncbi:MAG TPA: glycosyltransferase family 2 protein [Thermodesulfovibrionales bacterium]|nr:glycosyltransferase family 2 protein [Thermodesulfovibrionales bacterium]